MASVFGQITVDGYTKVEVKINNLTKDGARKIREEVIVGAQDIRNTMILSMRNTPKTGRVYRRQKGKKRHVASSPGNPPAKDYGELVRSITVRTRMKGDIQVGAESGAPYAMYLEKGTPKMAARPWAKPALDKNLPTIRKRILAIIKGII